MFDVERTASRGAPAHTGERRGRRPWRRERRAWSVALVALVTIGAAACTPTTGTPTTTTLPGTGPAQVTVTASSPSVRYGEPIPAITAIYTGMSGTPVVPATCTTTATSASPVGVYPTTCEGALDATHEFSYVAGQVTITKAPVSVTASSASMQYGGAVPAISASYSGLKNGQTEPDTLATCSTVATSTSPRGNYATTCLGAEDDNHSFTYVNGSLSIGRAPVTVVASSSTMTYGEAAPIVSASYLGFLNGTTVPAAAPNCSTTASPLSGVGTYPATCTGASDPNYSFTYTDGTVDVTPAPVVVTAASVAFTNGYPAPAIGASYSGLVNGASAPSTLPTCSTPAGAASPVGTYPTSCTGAADANYTFSYVDGVATVAPGAAPVVVTASSATITYGDAIPAISASYFGLPGGTTEPATVPTCSTTATASSGAGVYPVTCSGGAHPGFTFTYVNGSITILAATATVTASSIESDYGQAAPAVTPSYSGFLPGQSAPAVAPACGSAAGVGGDAGSYATGCLGASDPNYTFNYVGGTHVISPVAATITASSGTSVYGAPVPAVVAQYGGLVNGDVAAANTPTCTTTATSGAGVGSYPTTCSGAADGNYEFTYSGGTHTVTAKAAQVVANASSSAYGTTPATPTAGYVGLVNGDVAADTAPTCATTATSSSPVGSYPVTCSGAADDDYTFTYAAGTHTVSTAPVTVTASSATMAAGDAAPAITADYDGLVNGDTTPDTEATCSTVATDASAAGSYPSTCSGAADANYSFTYVDGTVTVTPSPVGFGAYATGVATTTIAAGSNGVSLPTGTINVASATGAGFTGWVNLTVVTSNGPQSVFCNGAGSTSFSTCTGGSGTMSTGDFVSATPVA